MTEILSIDTLIERPQIAIDGVTYEIVAPDELPLLASQKVAALGRRLDTLLKKDALTKAEARALPDTLASICAVVMEPVPPEIRAKLSEAQLMSVVEAFTMLSLGKKARLAGAMMRRATPPTGEKPSGGSSGSTAETPSAG